MDLGLLEMLIYGALSLFGTLIDLMPSLDFQIEGFDKALDFFIILISSADILVPTGDIFAILALVMVVRGTMFMVYLINWIIRRIGDIIP